MLNQLPIRLEVFDFFKRHILDWLEDYSVNSNTR
jgi:hypothetical protein